MNSVSKNEIKIVLDGNAWCAYRQPFRNLQEDDAGFGATPQIALTALLESELPDGWEEQMNAEVSPQTIEMLRKLLPKADPKYRFSRAERRRKEKQYQSQRNKPDGWEEK